MPDPPYQLTPRSSSGHTGYQPPSLFGDQFRLRLDLPYLPSQLGWATLSSMGQVYNLGLSLPGWTPSINDSFAAACAAVARAQSLNQPINTNGLAQAFAAAADSDLMDTLNDLFQDRFWQDIPSSRRNIVTGEPAGAGKIDPAGRVVPTSPDGLPAGVSAPLWRPISLGRRFLFASDPDVHLYIYVDPDAYLNNRPDLLFSGGAVGLEGRTSDGTPLKLRFGTGRDSAGGGAGFFNIQIGPDPTPQPASP
jgi:hypothetical protein